MTDRKYRVRYVSFGYIDRPPVTGFDLNKVIESVSEEMKSTLPPGNQEVTHKVKIQDDGKWIVVYLVSKEVHESYGLRACFIGTKFEIDDEH